MKKCSLRLNFNLWLYSDRVTAYISFPLQLLCVVYAQWLFARKDMTTNKKDLEFCSLRNKMSLMQTTIDNQMTSESLNNQEN